MKKLIIVSALLCSFLLAPVFVSAQTVDNSALIAQLQAEIQSLMQQIAAILAKQQPTQAATNYSANTLYTSLSPCLHMLP